MENKPQELSGQISFISQAPERITATLSKSTIAVNYTLNGREQSVPIEFYNDNAKQLKGINIGSHVHVSFHSKGKPNQKEVGKFYPSNEGIHITKTK